MLLLLKPLHTGINSAFLGRSLESTCTASEEARVVPATSPRAFVNLG